jgi:hypothetical protein
MDREQLFASIVATRPDRDDLVYLARRGDAYDWRIVPPGGAPFDEVTTSEPDVWMSFSVAWPVDDAARMRAFFDDLLAELESMADSAAHARSEIGTARCRWPIDEPWPHFH